MVERKLFKTKPCALFKKGHCRRQSCSFAHGHAELRRFSKSFDCNLNVHYYVSHVIPCNGRHDYRGGDLRDNIGRRRSPVHRYSPGRDSRVQRTSQGYSPSCSFEKRRKHKKRQLVAHSDISGCLKILDGVDVQVKDRKAISSGSKDFLDKKLRHVQFEIDLLVEHRTQLKIYLEEWFQEADTLTLRIQDLKMQLCRERDESKRIILKTKKFIKAHNHLSRIQEELLRSQARLHKLGDQLVSDAAKPGANEEDASINLLSDGETDANHLMRPQTELHKIASPSKKRQRIQLAEEDEQLKQAIPAEGEGLMQETCRSEKLLDWAVHHTQLNNCKEATVKLKVSESGLLLPSTSMAAHVVDEVVEIVEMDEKLEVVGNSSARVEKGVAYEVRGLPFPLPPPPLLPQNAYFQHRGEDENVDMDDLEEETVDVDII